MAFSGFQFTIWLGWLTGTLFLNKPWGRLHYSWFSFYSIYALLYNGFTVLLWVDFSFKGIEFIKCKSLTSKILNMTLIIGSLLFGVVLKLFFFTRAKLIAPFLEQIRSCKNEERLDSELKWSWKRFKILLALCSLYQIGGSVMLPIFLWHLAPHASLSFISSPYYHVSLFLFATFPTMTCVQLAFIHVVVSTFHVLAVVERFFVDLQEQIKIKLTTTNKIINQNYPHPPSPNSPMSAPLLPIKLTEMSDKSHNEQKRKLSQSTVTQLQDLRPQELSRQEIVLRLQAIRQLCSNYDRSVSPLFLALIIRCVFSLIHSADAILFESSDSQDEFSHFKKTFAWMHILFEFTQLGLIFVGTTFHKQVASYKERFADSVFMLEQSEVKVELDEIWKLVRDWKWEVTAWGIYTVDKPVFAGVVSAMMTYVVILFQVNLSDPGVPANSNCTVSLHVLQS